MLFFKNSRMISLSATVKVAVIVLAFQISFTFGGKLINMIAKIQHYVIKFVSDLRQVVGFHRVLRSPPPIKLTDTI